MVGEVACVGRGEVERAVAAGLATREVIRDENLLAHATELGEWTVEQLKLMKQRHPLIGEVRGLGLLMGVELLRADGSRAKEEAERVMYECLSRGLNFKVTRGNILTLTPALEILDQAIGAVEQSST